MASTVRVTQKRAKSTRIYYNAEASYYRMLYNYGSPGPAYAPYFNLSTYYNYTSGVIHRVTVHDLEPDVSYRYIVGDFVKNKVSSTLQFKTAPATTSIVRPVRLGFFADIAVTANSSDSVASLAARTHTAIAIVGDFAYANIFDDADNLGYFIMDSAQYSNAYRWDYLGRLIQPLLSKTPMLSCQGNHEREKQAGLPSPALAVQQGGQGNANYFKPWINRYGDRLPTAATGGSVFYYSTDIGPVHFVSLSPYLPYQPGSSQYRQAKH